LRAKKFTKFLQFSYKFVTSIVYNNIKRKNKDGKCLACWVQNIEQGRSSVQQALLPFYFGASEGVAKLVSRLIDAELE